MLNLELKALLVSILVVVTNVIRLSNDNSERVHTRVLVQLDFVVQICNNLQDLLNLVLVQLNFLVQISLFRDCRRLVIQTSDLNTLNF